MPGKEKQEGKGILLEQKEEKSMPGKEKQEGKGILLEQKEKKSMPGKEKQEGKGILLEQKEEKSMPGKEKQRRKARRKGHTRGGKKSSKYVFYEKNTRNLTWLCRFYDLYVKLMTNACRKKENVYNLYKIDCADCILKKHNQKMAKSFVKL